MPFSADDLLAQLARSRRPLSLRDLLAPLRLSRGERQAAEQLLEELIARGRVQRRRDGRLLVPRGGRPVSGRIAIHRDGYGFVTPEEGGEDIFVPARARGGAMNGDRVLLQQVRSGRGGREGEVAQVLERAHAELVGRFEGDDRYASVVPADPRLAGRIVIPPGARGAARPGDMVLVGIERFPEAHHPASGRILRVFGSPEDPEVEVRVLAHRYDLPVEFSAAALAEAAAIPAEVGAAELEGRVDLRALPLVTIDGETARDFDDAVAVHREGDGRWRLWVAIADVGHYVREGSALDLDARARGTSVYFPDRCLPMLPERLSNGICSLNPGVDRLVLVAEMLFDGQGGRLTQRFYPAVMRSCARLTYTEVAAWLEQPATAAIGLSPRPEVEAMRELALALLAMRRRRGALDFELAEAEVTLDAAGRPLQIGRRDRTVAHRLIEEFMLAANEAVAAWLEERQVPLLFRIHEPPDWDKLLAFQALVARFGYGLALGRGTVDPHELQRLLAACAGQPEERLFNQMLLRSLQQARYAPENRGHFGLAASSYCHFTSPIRRYPDLQVHRVLRLALVDGCSARQRERLRATLPELGEQLSACERRAMEAEREMLELKRCQFLAGHVGETFAGVVTGLQPFGLFVELREPFVEGLVPVASLADDYYEFDPDHYRLVGQRRRRIFQVGDELEVTVRRVDVERRQIELAPAGADEPAAPLRRRPAARGRQGRR